MSKNPELHRRTVRELVEVAIKAGKEYAPSGSHFLHMQVARAAALQEVIACDNYRERE